MKTSTDRILTTHVGSLPRPQEVADLLFAQDRGEKYDPAHFDQVMRDGVREAVRKQQEAGIDIVSDGETSKISYATYIRHRLTGFEGDSPRPTPQDIDELPDYRDRLVKEGASARYLRPVCKGPITVKNREPLLQDIARMKDALASQRGGRVHECGLAGHDCGVSAERVLPLARRVHGSSRQRHAGGVRNHRAIGSSAPGGLSRSGDGPAQPFPQSFGRRVPPDGGDPDRSAQPRAGQRSRRPRPPAYLLGQLRRAAHARYSARQGPPTVVQGQADGAVDRRRQPAPRARMGGLADPQVARG